MDPRFAGSNPAKSDGILRAIKIHSTISFRREVKLSAHVIGFHDMLNIP
jgi:hypothetical protein